MKKEFIIASAISAAFFTGSGNSMEAANEAAKCPAKLDKNDIEKIVNSGSARIDGTFFFVTDPQTAKTMHDDMTNCTGMTSCSRGVHAELVKSERVNENTLECRYKYVNTGFWKNTEIEFNIVAQEGAMEENQNIGDETQASQEESHIKNDMRNMTFRDKISQNGNFENANLNNVDFTRSDVSGSNFRGANLGQADFTDANLSGADFTGADLSAAILTNANVDQAIFDNAKLNGVHFEMVKKIETADFGNNADPSSFGHDKRVTIYTTGLPKGMNPEGEAFQKNQKRDPSSMTEQFHHEKSLRNRIAEKANQNTRQENQGVKSIEKEPQGRPMSNPPLSDSTKIPTEKVDLLEPLTKKRAAPPRGGRRSPTTGIADPEATKTGSGDKVAQEMVKESEMAQEPEKKLNAFQIELQKKMAARKKPSTDGQ